jgi:hypothetical protein
MRIKKLTSFDILKIEIKKKKIYKKMKKKKKNFCKQEKKRRKLNKLEELDEILLLNAEKKFKEKFDEKEKKLNYEIELNSFRKDYDCVLLDLLNPKEENNIEKEEKIIEKEVNIIDEKESQVFFE